MTQVKKSYTKEILTGIIGLCAGLVIAFLALRFQEEKLSYAMLESAKFGEITYQNIEITNSGWNPAENVKIYIFRNEVQPQNVKSSCPLNQGILEEHEIGKLDRIRRNEVVTLSLVFKGDALVKEDIFNPYPLSRPNFPLYLV